MDGIFVGTVIHRDRSSRPLWVEVHKGNRRVHRLSRSGWLCDSNGGRIAPLWQVQVERGNQRLRFTRFVDPGDRLYVVRPEFVSTS